MTEIITIAVDIAKNVFQVHGVVGEARHAHAWRTRSHGQNERLAPWKIRVTIFSVLI